MCSTKFILTQYFSQVLFTGTTSLFVIPRRFRGNQPGSVSVHYQIHFLNAYLFALLSKFIYCCMLCIFCNMAVYKDQDIIRFVKYELSIYVLVPFRYRLWTGSDCLQITCTLSQFCFFLKLRRSLCQSLFIILENLQRKSPVKKFSSVVGNLFNEFYFPRKYLATMAGMQTIFMTRFSLV